MAKLLTKIISSVVVVALTFLFSHTAFAWDNLADTCTDHICDHAGQDWVISAGTTIAGTHINVGNFIVGTGATASVKNYDGTNYGSFILSAQSIGISGLLTSISAGYSGGGISANGAGPGGGIGDPAYDGTGGGHGGKGNAYSSLTFGGTTYGDFFTPDTMGSGGGGGTIAAGNGGGAIKLTSANQIEISPAGAITSPGGNGANSTNDSAGGAGGSVWLIAHTISGSGVVSANGGIGGASAGGGGGGGRVALYYSSSYTFSGTLTANKSSYGTRGENGTVIIYDSTSNDIIVPTTQTWRAGPSYDGGTYTFRNFTVNPSVVLTLFGFYTNSSDGYGHTFNVTNFDLGSGASLDMTGTGYTGGGTFSNGDGPGGGKGAVNMHSSGAGYADIGRNSASALIGGSAYGTITNPTYLGSAAGSASSYGGSGGGAIIINASNTVTINGGIIADGTVGTNLSYDSGGGSGGSVNIFASTITGSGSITANGGNGATSNAGGGSGGRIALHYSSQNLFVGVTSVNYGSWGSGTVPYGTFYSGGYPGIPTNLTQANTSTGTSLAAQDTLYGANATFSFIVSHGTGATLTPQIELRDSTTSFSDVATDTLSTIQLSAGTTQTVSIGITGLNQQTYHWQARVCDQDSFCSSWVKFQANSNDDFTVELDSLSPVTNASNFRFKQLGQSDASWLASLPTILWDEGADDPVGVGLTGYCISLTEVTPGQSPAINDPCTSAGTLSLSTVILSGTGVDLNSYSDTFTPGKQYYFSIIAKDIVGNEYQGQVDGSDYSNLISFKYDPTPPENVTSISAVSGSFSSVSDLYFSWPTTSSLGATDTFSGLLGFQYSIGDTGNWHGDTYNSDIGTSIISVGYSQPFFLPASDASYIDVGINTIYFRAIDNVGNFSTPSSYRTALVSFGGDAPTFPDNSEVTISVVDVSSTRPANSFNVSWPEATAFQGNSIYKYYYMINTTPPSNYATITSNSALYIGTTALGLTAAELPSIHRGSNTIYVVAVDDNRDAQGTLSPNYSPSNSISATFNFNSDLPDPPTNLVSSDASIKAASLWRASLAWERPTYGGTGSLNFIVQRSSNGTTWTTLGTTSGYAYLDTVPLSQRYYWRVGSYDNSDDSQNSPSYANAVTAIPRGSYTSAADLSSGPSVSSITTKRAKISWSTSRGSDSKISYGTSSGDYYDEEPSNSTQTNDHTINLTNLSPGTTYYYKAKWTDEDGNTGESDESTFTTSARPSIKDAKATDISISSATITFTVSDANKIKMYYGKTSAFGGAEELNTSTTESSYSIKLTNLEDNTKYYYSISAFDSESEEYYGTTLDFTTLPRPKVSDIKVQQIPKTAQSTLLVTWKSNTEISSIITYYPISNSDNSRDEIDLKMLKGEHKMLLKGLLPDTDYILTVRGRDIVGNEAISEKINFTTATDTRPPSISDLNIEGSNVPPVNSTGQESSSQLIVSWTTDEPATTQVEYGEGSDSTYQQKTQEDTNLTYNHLVIISNLTPSKVYHLRAISNDKAKNTANSIDTVTITPKSTDNALNLVISNLSEAFGFLQFLQK